MSTPFKLLKEEINPASLLCRGCLAESGEMKNMHEWRLSDDFYKFTEVQINNTNELSGLLCTKCEGMLENCKSFREQCRRSDEVLRNMLMAVETKSLTECKNDRIDFVLTKDKLTYMFTPLNKHSKLSLSCPYKCDKQYTTKPNMMDHLIKKHDVKFNKFHIEIQFYCLFENCNYHKESYGYFSDRSLLNEHYGVHNTNDLRIEFTESFSKEMGLVDQLGKHNTSIENGHVLKDTEKSKKHLKNSVETILHENQLILRISAPSTDSKIYLPCPYNCRNSYIKKKDLLLHIIKHHNFDKSFIIKLEYYCSYPDCSYYIKAEKKCFNERKFLNQHYLKRHKSKDLQCVECSGRFVSEMEFDRHKKHCNVSFYCELCSNQYKTHERWLVHLMRKHPNLHQKYKDSKKSDKRKSASYTDGKKQKLDFEFMCDSPKRSFATQTNPFNNIRNDVTLSSCTVSTKKDEISTQTGFEDILSLKSQNSEEDSLFFAETVSISDIQTQTVPVEFGLSRLDKETITSETQLPEVTIKETQTCVCLYDSPKPNFRLFDSFSSSPASINLTSTETQTAGTDCNFTLNSAETQTCFDDDL